MTVLQSLQTEYEATLVGHISKADEAALAHAYELGRKVLTDGFGVLDLVSLHNDAIKRLIDGEAKPTARADLDRASEFLTESLSAFEMSLRGYREANSRLAALNVTLQELYELAGGLNRCRTESEVTSFSLDRIMHIPGVRHAWISMQAADGTKVIRDQRADAARDGAERPDAPPDGCTDESISVPLTLDGKPCGDLNLRRVVIGPAFTTEERKTLINIGNQISNALERARLYETLERKVAERTQELVKANKVKDDFLAVVSHELRTPLTSIKAVIEMLDAGKLGVLSGTTQKFVRLALSNCERLMRIVNDLLDLTRIANGTFAFDLGPVKLGPIIAEVIEGKQVGNVAQAINFSVDDAAKDIVVAADAQRLQQVIDNLISNAKKFSKPEMPIAVTMMRRGAVARVAVADRGDGIPEDFHGEVFKPFTQADSTSTRRIGGVGLGLKIAKAIVEAHRGTIEFTSAEGVGTTFYFELPIVADTAAMDDAAA